MQRIAVIGATGSGKTTFARQIAARLGCPHVELDALHWNPGWQEAPLDVFRARVEQATAAPRWVTDGNYSKVRDIIWGRADTVVWLDYPFALTLGRLLRRTVRRVVTREELWNTNRESLRANFSRDSIILWLFQSYPRRRREYPVLFRQPEYTHLTVVRLRQPSAAARWLGTLHSPTDHPPSRP